jgi:hypothetical protein
MRQLLVTARLHRREAYLAVIYMLHTLLTVKHVSTGKHRIFLFSVHADYTD